MPSRQFQHLRVKSQQTLKAMIPSGCPLYVMSDEPDRPARDFRVMTLDGGDVCSGRYQIVATFIAGYVAAWKRVRPSEPHVVGTDPPTVENDPIGRFR
jgi:hypothetical protein